MITKESHRIFASGFIGQKEALEIIDLMDDKVPCTVDMDHATDIDFSAMRALLQHRQQGHAFFIANAPAAIDAKFATTGADKFISVTGQPVEVDMADYQQSGDGYTALSYNHKDGQQMMKLYYDFMPLEVVEREKRTATAALMLGIHTPMAGPMVRNGNRFGVSFERIANKKSFARAMADDPESTEYYAVTFANLCKNLHSTECDTAVFPPVVEFYRALIGRTQYYGEEQKAKLMAFVDTIEHRTTCIHGDLHIGNVITNGTDNLLIDMADFAYGHPWFDIGLVYLTSNCLQEEQIFRLFHISGETYRRFWGIFVREYFGISTDEEVTAVEKQIKPFTALKMLHFGEIAKHLEDNFREFIDREFGF